MSNKRYLGDGVYIDKDVVRGAYILTTEDGIAATNKIYLEPVVLIGLFRYLEQNMPTPDAVMELQERFEETKKLFQDLAKKE